MRNALKHAGRAVATMLPAALIAGLGTHGLAAMIIFAGLVVVLGVVAVVLAFICRGMLRWIIDSSERSDRMNRMILAKRGDSSCLKPDASTSPSSR